MNNGIVKYILRAVLLLLLQALLINNLHWLGIFHPYVYILCLLMLPGTTPRWLEMILGAVIGLLMDTICSTSGVHMAACVAISYLRPLLLNHFVQDSQRVEGQVCSASIGSWPFISIMVILTLIHHSLVIFLEAWSWQHTAWLLLHVSASVLVTCLLCLFYDRSQQ